MAIEKVIQLKTEFDDKGLDQLNSGLETTNQQIKEAEQGSKDLAQQNKKTGTSFKGVSTAVKGLGVALKAAGIGLVIAVFAKLTELVSQNQKVVDTLSTTWNALGLVVNDVIGFFTNFQENITNLGNTIKNIFLQRVTATIAGVNSLGQALISLFEGDFKGALDSASKGIATITSFTDAEADALNTIKDYTKEVTDQASAFTQLTNQAQIAEAQLRRVFEQSDRDAEIQRRIRDDFNLSFQERIEASLKLAEILDEQEKTQLKLAGIEVARAQQAIKFTGDNVENQVALINALAEQDAIEADIAGRRAEQEAQDRALRQEIIDARQQDTLDIQAKGFRDLEINQEKLDAEITQEIDAQLERKRIRDEEQAQEQARAQALEDFKLNVAQAGLASLSLLAERGSTGAKAIAVAQAILSTYQGINKALAETTDFTPTQSLRFANAFAVGLTGFANVASILRTDATGKSTPSVPNATNQGAGVNAPAFNIVGDSGISQIAETLNQEQQPIEAYVVAGNVTSAQEVNRDIINTASIG